MALVLLGSAAFALATVLVVGYQVQVEGPHAGNDAARTVLGYTLALTAVGAVTLRSRGRPDQHETFARASLVMTIAGLAGYVVALLVNPRRGLADLASMVDGHLVLGVQPGWGLWPYLVLSAPLVNWASSRAPAPPAWALATWWPALYLSATGLWELQYRLRETGGEGHALFAVLLASSIVGAATVYRRSRSERAP